jgi:hypothetical protein
VGTETFSVAVGDFNRDGNPDLATADSSGGTVTILLGDETIATSHKKRERN